MFCSDDADKLKIGTQEDRDKKSQKPDSDARVDLLEKGTGVAAGASSTSYRSEVSRLVKSYVMSEEKDSATLEQILIESKQFGKAFLKEATPKEVQARIKDYKEQLARGPESRAHTAALYGGLCGLGEHVYCKTKVKK